MLKLLDQNNTLLGLAILGTAGGGFVAGLLGLDPLWGLAVPAAVAVRLWTKNDES